MNAPQQFSAAPREAPEESVQGRQHTPTTSTPTTTVTTPHEQLAAIHDEKVRLTADHARLERALADKRITFAEYRAYIHSVHKGKLLHEELQSLNNAERHIIALMNATPRARKPVVATTTLLLTLFLLGIVLLLVVTSSIGKAPETTALATKDVVAEPAEPFDIAYLASLNVPDEPTNKELVGQG